MTEEIEMNSESPDERTTERCIYSQNPQ